MLVPSVKLLLLDLDNTLWDFDANAEDALTTLFHRHHLHIKSGYNVQQFVALYQKVNKTYWTRYENGEIEKDFLRTERFADTFRQMGIPETDHPESIWEEYLEICPVMTRLISGALPFLEAMSAKYKIGLLTNGFDKTQNLKIKHAGIQPFVDFMVTSESAGFAKPNKAVFDLALDMGECLKSEAIYMGDNLETDVKGGIHAGIRTIWFNRHNLEVSDLTILDHPLYIGQACVLLEAATLVDDNFGL